MSESAEVKPTEARSAHRRAIEFGRRVVDVGAGRSKEAAE